MIKADAYGHGIKEVHNYLVSEKLIQIYGVASVSELNELKLDSKSEYWIFSEVDLENNINIYNSKNVVPVISSVEDLIFYLKNFESKKLILKFDTGMNRLGIRTEEIKKLKEVLYEYRIKSVDHIMTHFSSSYLKIKTNSKAQRQKNSLFEIKKNLENEGMLIKELSYANSGAIEQSFYDDSTHIRPGLMLYGAVSYGIFSNRKNEMEAVSSLSSKIISLKELKKGDQVGYGETPLAKDGWIAYIPLGYGDGLLTSYTGATVKCGDTKGKIFARVNMDLCAIFFEEKPSQKEVVIWDDNLSEFAKEVNSIPYQVLTSISRRVPKIYKY